MKVNVADINLLPSNPTCRTFRVSAPPNTAIWELEFSPEGDRIAWLVEQEQDTPMSAYLRHLFPIMKWIPHEIVGIWVCRLDGSKMHEIGHMPLRSDDEMLPDNLQWLPSGQRLSFTYKGALYTVPVD